MPCELTLWPAWLFRTVALAALMPLAACTSVPLDGPWPSASLPPPPVARPEPVKPPPTGRDTEMAAFSTRLDGRNEVPPVYSVGTGTVDAVLNRQSGLFQFRVSFSNLSGPITAAHFHGPADVGVNAGPQVALNPPYTSPYQGRVTLSPAQRADLLAGRWYLNLHTERFAGGELRGQLVEQR